MLPEPEEFHKDLTPDSIIRLMDLTLWLHKEEVKWFSVDEAKTEASELQPFQVRESRIKVAARSVEERDTSNGKKGQPLRAAPFVKETKAYASNTSRSIEPDKQSNRLQIHTRSGHRGKANSRS